MANSIDNFLGVHAQALNLESRRTQLLALAEALERAFRLAPFIFIWAFDIDSSFVIRHSSLSTLPAR